MALPLKASLLPVTPAQPLLYDMRLSRCLSRLQDHDKNLADDPSQQLSKEERRRAAAQERRRLKLQVRP